MGGSPDIVGVLMINALPPRLKDALLISTSSFQASLPKRAVPIAPDVKPCNADTIALASSVVIVSSTVVAPEFSSVP